MDDDGFLLLLLRILLLGNLPGFLTLYSIQLNLPIWVDLDPTYLQEQPSRIPPIVPQEKTIIIYNPTSHFSSPSIIVLLSVHVESLYFHFIPWYSPQCSLHSEALNTVAPLILAQHGVSSSYSRSMVEEKCQNQAHNFF